MKNLKKVLNDCVKKIEDTPECYMEYLVTDLVSQVSQWIDNEESRISLTSEDSECKIIAKGSGVNCRKV